MNRSCDKASIRRTSPEPQGVPKTEACLHSRKFHISCNLQNLRGSFNVSAFGSHNEASCLLWGQSLFVECAGLERKCPCEGEGPSPIKGRKPEHVFSRTQLPTNVFMIGMNLYLVQTTGRESLDVQEPKAQAPAKDESPSPCNGCRSEHPSLTEGAGRSEGIVLLFIITVS